MYSVAENLDLILLFIGFLVLVTPLMVPPRRTLGEGMPWLVKVLFVSGTVLTVCGLAMLPARLEKNAVPPLPFAITAACCGLVGLFFLWRCRDVHAVAKTTTEKARSLIETASLFTELVEGSGEGIALIRDGIIIYATPALSRQFGVLTDSVVGTSFYAFIEEADQERVAQFLQERSKGDRILSRIDAGIITRDGRHLSALIGAQRVSYYGTQVLALFLRDITDQKTAIEFLRESEGKYRQIFEGDPSAICIIDTSSREIMDANPAALKLYGYARDAFLSLRYEDISAVPDNATEAIRALQLKGSLPEPLNWHMNREGSPFPVEVSAGSYPLGYRTALCAIIRDVTERYRTERAQREAREAAEKASLAKTRFLAVMSHELRTPLAGVMGLMEDMLGGEPTPEQISSLNQALDASGLLLSTIDDILDFAKLEAEELVLRHTDFDVYDLLQTLVRRHSPLAKQKDLTLALEIDGRVPRVLQGDPDRLRQAITQLVSNALKFTEQGAVTVHAGLSANGAAPESGTPITLAVAVQDTGTGIPPREQRAIFEPFRQADGTSTRRFGGSGLGLAITRKLAAFMHGDLTVESEERKGSTFTLKARFLPGNPEKVAAAGEQTPLALRPLKVLLVEDNMLNVKVISLTLSRMGHQAIPALNGREALEQLARAAEENAPFDVVLMDIEMPVMDGVEATRLIRKGEAGEASRRIPVIVMTAHSESLFRDQCMAAGADAFENKPLRRQTLSRLFERLVPGAGDLSSAEPQAQAQTHAEKAEDAQEAPPTWDREGIMRRLDIDAGFLTELCAMFLQDSPGLMESLGRAVKSGDMKTAASTAHALKNECLNIGAESSRALAQNLVQAARAGQDDTVADLFGRLKDEMAKLTRLLPQRLQ